MADVVADRLGADIVAGILRPGDGFTLQGLIDRFAVSRTVAREAMRLLEEMSLVAARPRVGITVLPPDAWDRFNPRLIRWRLDSPHRDEQLRSLTELREAVEPAAARLAAERATPAERERLVRLAHDLRDAATTIDGAALARIDIDYHTALLAASHNEMFAALTGAVAEVLDGRIRLGLQPSPPEADALDLHLLLARSVADGDRAAAERHARALVHEVRDALARR